MGAQPGKGEQVPDFALPDHTGTTRILSDLLADGPVVLFFFPVPMSLCCATENRHFKALAAQFAALGARPVGISPTAETQLRRFALTYRLNHPLLSDRDEVIAERFGVRRRIPWGPWTVKRRTFVIDTDRTVLDVVYGELSPGVHAREALAALRERLPG